MQKKIIITQSNYIPWKGYFDGINTADLFVVYDEMQFTRRDWRNRNIIKTAQGPKWLTIPVDVKGKYLQKISETRISDSSWNQQHWQTIQDAYGKTPFFKQYKDFFADLYNSATSEWLHEVNVHFLHGICDLLGIKTEFADSASFTLAEDRNERLLNIAKELEATDYYSGPAAKAYMNTDFFTEAGINVHFFDNSGYPEYPQLFPPFEHAVSILDLIFNTGPEVWNFMKTGKIHA